MMPLSKNCASLVKFTPPPPSNRSPGKIIAFGCLALSMSLVGIYVALSKPLATALPVFLLGWLRFGIGVVAMARWLKKPADEAPMSAQTKRLVFLESLLGNFLFSVCMLYGVSLTSAVSAGVIMSTIPATCGLPQLAVFAGKNYATGVGRCGMWGCRHWLAIAIKTRANY